MKKNLLVAGLMILGVSAIAQTPRLSLYEEFTGETCPPCASTNPGLNALLASPTNTPKIVAIKWQVPIPSAPSNTWSLYQTNKAEIDWRWRGLTFPGYGYTPAINSAPSSKIDGREATVFGASSGHPANLNNNVIAAAQSQTAAFSVTMNRAWDATGTAINLTVNIQATAPFTAVGPLVFRTVMVERLITFSVQPGTNGEKVFEDAVIKSFPTIQNGISMAPTWTVGQTQSFTLSCAIPSYVRKRSEIAFVGFIQDDGNQRVAQAVRADKQPVPDDAQAVAANVNIACSNTIAPQITIKNNGLNAITAMTIAPFIDGTASTPQTWSGNLASGASTVITLNALTAPTAAGAHTFSYNITSMNAVDIDPTNNTAKVAFVVASNYQGTPVAEGFEATFPPAGFTAINPNGGAATWSKSTNTGTGAYNLSSFSAKYNFYTNTEIGDMDELVLPPINLVGTSVPELDFDIAYVQRNTSSNDKLEVFASTDCGATWTSVWSQAGANMTTMSPVTYAYVPGANITDWRTEQILLNNFNSASVLVKFVTTSDNGNNLYLDNINLFQAAPTGVAKNKATTFQALVFPNPASNNANIRITTPVAGNAKVTVMNMIGQVVSEKQTAIYAGTNNVSLDVKDLSAGVYTIMIDTNNGTIVKKLNVTK